MIRYYQVGEKGTWQPMRDVPQEQLFHRLFELGASRFSILAVNREVTDEVQEDHDELRYTGPWYADIDCGDLNQAIASAQELAQKLIDLRVPEDAIEAYCSGSKGFHILVSPRAFRQKSERPVAKLPYIYREVARSLFVIGLDFQVYSGGRGRMFRPPGCERPDNRYRTRVTLEDLFRCTPELYQLWVNGSRPPQSWPTYSGEVVEAMAIRYQEAMRKVRAKEAEEKNTVTTEELRQFQDLPPPCIDLVAEGKVRKHANFNQIAMQTGIYLARSGARDHVKNTIIDRISVTHESNSYKSERGRQLHLRQETAYMGARSNYKFSCGAMRGLVGNEACQNCPLKDASGVNGTEPDEVFQLLIEERDTGYIRLTEDGIQGKGFTNFVLKPREAFYHSESVADVPIRRLTTVDLWVNGHKVGERTMPEHMFRSKGEMVKALEGTPAIFNGTDAEAQQLKSIMFERYEPEETVMVYSAGINPTKVREGIYLMTYCEPGWSIDQHFAQDTHSLKADIKGKPELKNLTDIVPEDKTHLERVLRELLQVNSPSVVAVVLGWHMACHLKSHIFVHTHGFPLINLWGAAGCGKTETAKMFSWLNGAVYGGGEANDIITTTMTTKLPVIEHVANMVTIPRIMEEYNEAKFPAKALFHFVTEVLKAAYNNGSIPRGRLVSNKDNYNEINAESTDSKVRAPIVVCSEQHPNVPALQERTLSVQMSKTSRSGRAPHFMYAKRHKKDILRVAKYLTMKALKTPMKEVHALIDHYDAELPQDLSERPRLCYAAVYSGLDFFHHAIVSEEGLGLSGLKEDYLRIRGALDNFLLDNRQDIVRAKSRTEADNFLGAVAEMAHISLQDPTVRFNITAGEHFLIKGDSLHLDVLMIMHKYKAYMREEGSATIYSKYAQVLVDLREEPYFVTSKGHAPNPGSTRLVPVLSLTAMQDKGIDSMLFLGH